MKNKYNIYDIINNENVNSFLKYNKAIRKAKKQLKNIKMITVFNNNNFIDNYHCENYTKRQLNKILKRLYKYDEIYFIKDTNNTLLVTTNFYIIPF